MIIDINVILARRRRRKFGQLDLGKTLVCKNSPLFRSFKQQGAEFLLEIRLMAESSYSTFGS